MTKKTKKRNPQDATLRNIRALKKRVDAMESQLNHFLNELYSLIFNEVTTLTSVTASELAKQSKRKKP